MREQVCTLIEREYEEMVAIRRYLHERPELSFQEVHTPAYIANYLRELGLEVREHVGGRGVVAKLKGALDGKTIALRADFDALAIQELNDVPYKSKNEGVMHACGHDGHTAILMVVAKVLASIKETLRGTVVFIFQHAEELAPGGAIAMIEDGCLQGVDAIFGLHLWAPAPLGEVLVREGAILAAADRVEINIEGKGGHGAEPHRAVDAVLVASQFVTQVQTIVSRTIDPLQSAVVSVGHFEAINPFNVIAQRVSMLGTVRTFNEEVRTHVEHKIDQLLQGLAHASDATYSYRYVRGYPPVVNHSAETKLIESLAPQVKEVTNVRTIEPMMIGEDFAYYLQHVPGTFFLVGAKDPSWDVVYPHHHPRFNFDERAMLISAKLFLMTIIDYC